MLWCTAITIYLPPSSLASVSGLLVVHFPLSCYRYCSFYTIRTDAHDCFGTTLVQRFIGSRISAMRC